MAPRGTIWSGSFTLLGVVIGCRVLDDGSRIIDAKDFATFLAVLPASGARAIDESEFQRFSRWQRGED